MEWRQTHSVMFDCYVQWSDRVTANTFRYVWLLGAVVRWSDGKHIPSCLTVMCSGQMEWRQTHSVSLQWQTRPTGSGSSLTVRLMPSGLRTWTQCSMTTRSCAWWVEKSYRWLLLWASSLKLWISHKLQYVTHSLRCWGQLTHVNILLRRRHIHLMKKICAF